VKIFCTVTAVCLVGFVFYWLHRPLTYPPGVLVSADPEQTEIASDASEVARDGFRLKPLARFSADARILHRRSYRYDAGAQLVPVDLAIGWGPMSDQAVLDRLTISQSMRFYFYEYRLPPPIAQNEIISHSTNVHIIPATPELKKRAEALRAGVLVHLSGELVEANGPGIGTWRSSLSRTDSGRGACELLLLESLETIDPEQRGQGELVAR
jgi:hypothetical protein